MKLENLNLDWHIEKVKKLKKKNKQSRSIYKQKIDGAKAHSLAITNQNNKYGYKYKNKKNLNKFQKRSEELIERREKIRENEEKRKNNNSRNRNNQNNKVQEIRKQHLMSRLNGHEIKVKRKNKQSNYNMDNRNRNRNTGNNRRNRNNNTTNNKQQQQQQHDQSNNHNTQQKKKQRSKDDNNPGSNKQQKTWSKKPDKQHIPNDRPQVNQNPHEHQHNTQDRIEIEIGKLQQQQIASISNLNNNNQSMYTNNNPSLTGYQPPNGSHYQRNKMLSKPNSFVPGHLATAVNEFERTMPLNWNSENRRTNHEYNTDQHYINKNENYHNQNPDYNYNGNGLYNDNYYDAYNEHGRHQRQINYISNSRFKPYHDGQDNVDYGLPNH